MFPRIPPRNNTEPTPAYENDIYERILQ
jgi:hypothetical protein